MAKSSALLKVVSLILIIGSLLTLVPGAVAVIALAGGTGLATGSGILAILVVIAGALSMISAILMLIAGIRGLNGRPAKGLMTFVLVIGVIGLVFALLGGDMEWSNVSPLVLPILYLLGVKRAS